MQKHFIVSQPPVTEKYRLLVDDMSQNRNFGYTNDLDKVRYNRNLINESFNQDISIKNLFSTGGVTAALALGRFITIVSINKEETQARMTMFDFNTDMSEDELRHTFSLTLSENVVDSCMKIHKELRSDFLEEDDIFELFLPQES